MQLGIQHILGGKSTLCSCWVVKCVKGEILHVMHHDEITPQDREAGGFGAAGAWRGMNHVGNQGVWSIFVYQCVAVVHICVCNHHICVHSCEKLTLRLVIQIFNVITADITGVTIFVPDVVSSVTINHIWDVMTLHQNS